MTRVKLSSNDVFWELEAKCRLGIETGEDFNLRKFVGRMNSM